MKYICSECESLVIVIDGVLHIPCSCEAPIIAEMESSLVGKGGIS